jgi:diadenosine tetraphosphate (Ap4A) HIT family hydrolase
LSEFVLHQTLDRDCHFITDLELSRLLLLDDCQYPWCVLVPRVPDVREIYELSEAQQLLMLAESSRLARLMMSIFHGEKFNIAALGNVVPQLHVHHIVRKQSDPAWPKPVWGHAPAVAYQANEVERIRKQLIDGLERD